MKNLWSFFDRSIQAPVYFTDCFSDYYAKMATKEKRGLADLPQYETECASFEDLKKQNSYFIKSLLGDEKEKEKRRLGDRTASNKKYKKSYNKKTPFYYERKKAKKKKRSS